MPDTHVEAPPVAAVLAPKTTITLHCSDNIAALKSLASNSVDSIVTDPPYGLSQHSAADITTALTAWASGKEYLIKKKGFMGKTWDSFVPGPELWKEVFRVLKPGGHVLCFAGSRTDDLMGIALRLAGFEIRDKIMWIYGTGFPKSLNISKAIDKAARGVPQGGTDPTSKNHGKYKGGCSEDNPTGRGFGAGPGSFMADQGERETTDFDSLVDEAKTWDGWGTALKPAFEPIIVARKPIEGTVAANVLKHGVGGINVDACRVPTEDNLNGGAYAENPTDREEIWGADAGNSWKRGGAGDYVKPTGRFPANIIHDGSDEVEEAFAVYGQRTSGVPGVRQKDHQTTSMSGTLNTTGLTEVGYADTGSVSRFFYSSKAGKTDRADSKHPTVKPVSLMRYLVKLVTPPNGVVLDPFAGSGTTGAAAIEEGFNVILMERETEYQNDIIRRFDKVVVSDPSVALNTVRHDLPADDED